ncbi:GerAB/ArcD/ProY family transporter [Effusibacillus pohliae]|uniref:GerAB/ArcD/ProY family transporter n=1 Tax=Effusibacillus pohliae TaxID=232270 RepID=UPI00036C8A54|nr:endospore germination permease [Effusibacillus pohliae]
MIEKGKISSFQLAMLMYIAISATAILLAPSMMAKHAERDLWLSPIWASSAGFFCVYVAHRLNKLHPRSTPIEYSASILGKLPGKIVGLVFLFFYLHITSTMLKEYGEFVVGIYFTRTPMVVILGSMAFVCALTVHGGLEVLARVTQFFLPMLVFFMILIILLSIPDFDTRNLFPFMRHGIVPSIRGAAPPLIWFSEFMIVAFLLPFVSDRDKGMKFSIVTVLAVLLTIVMANISALLLFGNILDTLVYPMMETAKYISIADFLEHMESIVMAIWVAGAFLKISVFFYVLVLGTAQWIGLSDYRPLAFPIGFLLVAFSMWSFPTLPAIAHFIEFPAFFYFVTIHILIPVALWLMAAIRRGKSPGEREMST